MKKYSKPIRIPTEMYNFLKNKAKNKDTSLRIEANEMYRDYFRLKKMEKKLEGKKLFRLT